MVEEAFVGKGSQRPNPRPGEVRDPAQILLGRRFKRHVDGRIEEITVVEDDPTLLREKNEVLLKEPHVTIETDRLAVHAQFSTVPPREKSIMFLSDVGLLPYSEDGSWNQQNYLTE